MIKLNNKNITYVAFADSNNSLKAPKEIWYADSNNSVKLVYRRKDALIEGVDYEKYHWLRVETGMQNGYYMSLPMSTNFSFTRKYLSNWSNTWYYWTPNYIYYTDNHRLIAIYDSVNRIVIDSGDTSTISIGDTINIISTPDLLLFNGKTINRYNYASSRVQFSIFNASRQIITSLNSAITVNDSMRYIPCKLLKPVPKWLDANGIRRQVGECGMIDLVSGKFYGNVNSVGTFTVENYYDRKEWLVGDGSAYIDTNIIVDVPSLRYSLEFIHDTNNIDFLCGSRDSTQNDSCSSAIMIDNVHNDMIRLDAISTNLLYVNIMPNVPNEVHIDCQTNSAIVNNSSIPGNRTIFNNSSNTFRIFSLYPKDNSMFPNTCTCKMSYFNLYDCTHSLNLIPCTLTMDLPASMDANNIARTKGTSGMWDLVSDRFYGNVANSGTFKAVNLAEGVDYEVHQWLKVSVSTNVDMAALPVNSPNLYFKHKHISGKNYHYFRTTGEGVDYDYYYALDTARCSIWNLSNKTSVYINRDITEDEIVIDCNSSNRYFNGYDIPIYGSTIKQVSIISRDRSGFEGLISSITVDGVERYIPVKLLKSIPSKYDANGIARQAGECGMYDTVNDKFYGNVASRGTFSVSDDS